MNLNFKSYGEGFPLVILHGLLGSLDNWNSIARQLSKHFTVFAIDQRNHGKSPHSEDFSYQILVNDLKDFFAQHRIEKAHILGHSMGGKVAMKFAMQYPEMVEKLIIADVAPVYYEDRHSQIFKAILSVDLSKAESREEVENHIRKNLKNEDAATIQFILKGLYRDEENKFEWRFNAPVLWKKYQAISDEVSGTPFLGKSLFIKGQKSNYISAESYAEIMRLFPNNELEEIENAGHWVHAANPNRFIEIVENFLAKK